ncbi:hypothetical protein CK222_21510 [Mesorhizobium sp. WSM3866]|uniref:hypothetical protein n=1 Tax=Mesorhizobium sp. WSM3866 TaxID=422271 RepID=UPI000BAEC8FE|nr:hypothetical protein [Mesorhizobium sp. WSM3866]PBB41736.1 hypothetical protein CK222_21510 [Mesorhizobium sp. WSM3866]
MITKDQAILCYELFQGDRDSEVTIFRNKMVVTRKEHPCCICTGLILPKSRVRAQTERENDEKIVMTFYACGPCCEAMAVLVLTGNDEPIYARHDLAAVK